VEFAVDRWLLTVEDGIFHSDVLRSGSLGKRILDELRHRRDDARIDTASHAQRELKRLVEGASIAIMARKMLSITRSSSALGAEVRGIDLASRLTSDQFEAIRSALLENQVIFFRDQVLNPDQQKALGQRFGKLHIHPAPLGVLDRHPEVIVIKADETSTRIAGETWHSDVSCDLEPPMGSILYLTEVPPIGGDTLFASMYAAHDALSDSMRRFLSDLTAIHDGSRNYEGRRPVSGHGHEFPRAEHPVIRTHPETGRSALFVNRMFTTRIVQLGESESGAILEMLFRHIENPAFQCRFVWQPGSVAFWDNRCTQHFAVWDYYPHRRYGYRVTICGDKPFHRA
jgi:taurine dioxygenase